MAVCLFVLLAKQEERVHPCISFLLDLMIFALGWMLQNLKFTLDEQYDCAYATTNGKRRRRKNLQLCWEFDFVIFPLSQIWTLLLEQKYHLKIWSNFKIWFCYACVSLRPVAWQSRDAISCQADQFQRSVAFCCSLLQFVASLVEPI